MTRIQTLASRPKRTLGALAVVLAAVGITVGSGANFSATQANAGTFAAGTMTLSADSDATLFQVGDMRPGVTKTGTVDVTNTGSLSGDFYLKQTIGAARPSSQDAALLSKMTLKITDCGPVALPDCSAPVGGAAVYNGPMTGFASQVALKNLAGSQAKWPAGQAHHFQFDVSFPDSGGADGSDNTLQGAQVAASYAWKATS